MGVSTGSHEARARYDLRACPPPRLPDLDAHLMREPVNVTFSIEGDLLAQT
jgi:hypothetical protein